MVKDGFVFTTSQKPIILEVGHMLTNREEWVRSRAGQEMLLRGY